MTDVEQLLQMNYQECCNFLIRKYGPVTGDYFCIDGGGIFYYPNRKIKRLNEGLFIHHIDADKAVKLSTIKFAKRNSFNYQKANRLLYCNLLEHLVLHIKIVEFPNPNKNFDELPGVEIICKILVPQLTDIYSGIKYSEIWKQKVAEVVLPLKSDYLKCIKKLVELNFSYPLLTSYDEKPKIWNSDKNKPLCDEMKKLGIENMITPKEKSKFNGWIIVSLIVFGILLIVFVFTKTVWI